MFDIQWGLFIWTIIVFLLLMLILGKWAFPIILKALKDREEKIESSLLNADLANKKAEELIKESQSKLDNAQKEINELINKAKVQADNIIYKANEEAEVVKKQKIEDTLKEIERKKDSAISEIRKEVADMVIMATEKLIYEKLDLNKHQSLIENYLNNKN